MREGDRVMAIKKSELYSSLWKSCDELRGGKEMQDRLSNLVAIFENPALNFRKNRADGDDILGDAYEYLMRNFATQSSKSKGQFYTPAEVSRVISKVIGVNSAQSQDRTIYDPTCGSGSLLLKSADEAERGLTTGRRWTTLPAPWLG